MILLSKFGTLQVQFHVFVSFTLFLCLKIHIENQKKDFKQQQKVVF